MRGQKLSHRTVLTHANYIVESMLGRPLITLVTLVALLNSIFISVRGFQPESVEGIEATLSLLYALASGLIAAGLAEELGGGQALAYLIHPITSREYILAWMLAGSALIGASYVIAVLSPYLILSPTLLAEDYIVKPLLLGLGTILYYTMISITASIILRNRSLVSLLIISYSILVPIIATILSEVVSAAGFEVDYNIVTAIVTFFIPIIAVPDSPAKVQALGYLVAYGGTLTLGFIADRLARRMEV